MFKSMYGFIFLISLCSVIMPVAEAGQCGEYVFKHAILRKYKYAQNTLSQNARKHGISTSGQYTTETSTAITDPGVTSGVSSSSGQAVSSRGPCAAIDKFRRTGTMNKYYIEQNLDEVKMEMAKGSGEHLYTIAYFSGCNEMAKGKLISKLNQEYESFAVYKDNDGEKFHEQIEKIIDSDKFLSSNCERGSI